MEILFLLIGLVLGFVIAFLFSRSKQNSSSDSSAVADAKVNARLEAVTDERNRLSTEINKIRQDLGIAMSATAAKEAELKGQAEKYSELKSEVDNLNKKYTIEFENLANKILDEKTSKFTEQNKTNLDIILNPLKEKIKEFENKVDATYKAEAAERNSLKGEISSLVKLNQQISAEAANLAKALKGDNKMQGNWGEIILEKILESSGLKKDVEYKTQDSTTNEEGKRILPDVVIYLPDNKHIVVDSKVSLLAYEGVVNAETVEDKERFTKEHLLSLRTHVKLLSDKNYQSALGINSPDFVLLFIPIESSFGIAVQADQELFSFAWERKIVIVSPSTLLATLRTIASLWKQERQTRNHLEIAKTGGELYDKFTGFVADMLDLGRKLEQGQNTYKDAMNKLVDGRGNVVKQIEKLKDLGAKATKDLPKSLVERAEE